MEEILGRILGIEAEARAIVSEAREAARMLREQMRKEIEEMLTQARKEAEREAKALQEKARQEAEEERARILSQTEQELQHLEEKGDFGKAVNYVVKAISGRGES